MNRQTAAGDKILPFVARFYLPSGTAHVSNRRERPNCVKHTPSLSTTTLWRLHIKAQNKYGEGGYEEVLVDPLDRFDE